MKFLTTVLTLVIVTVAIDAANIEVLSKGFFEEITPEQSKCLIDVYSKTSCKVMEAMDECSQSDRVWSCLSQIPEVNHCLPSIISFVR